MIRSPLAATALILLAATVVPAQSGKDNVQLGTWKMNMTTSHFSSGTGFRSATVTITETDGLVTHMVDTVYADGSARRYHYSTRYDGKDMPVVGNSPYGNTTAITRVDARTTRTIYKNNGQPTVTQIAAVSEDGKTRTVTSTGTNPKGQQVHNVSVYDRQ